MLEKGEYTATRISKDLDMPYQKVNRRFNSKYADRRWGIAERMMPDGSVKKYVRVNKIYLWLEKPNYIGRPSFRNNFSKKKNGKGVY